MAEPDDQLSEQNPPEKAAAQWLYLAKLSLLTADSLSDPAMKREMLEIVAGYRRLAKLAELHCVEDGPSTEPTPAKSTAPLAIEDRIAEVTGRRAETA